MVKRFVICVISIFSFYYISYSAIPSSELDPYILQVPTINSTTGADDIIALIRKQVTKIVTENRHDLVGGRLWGTANQLLWGHGRAVASLAQTIPFLDSTLANQLKTYLAYEVDNYLLNATYLNSEVSGSLGTASGASYGISWTGNNAFRWDALYGLWAYAYYTGDWTRIQNNWTTIKNIYSQCVLNSNRVLGQVQASGTDVITSSINNEIAGLMGMARMARYLNDTTTESSVKSSAYTRMNNKIDEITAANNNPVTLGGGGTLGRFLYIAGYQDLTFDLCRFIANYQLTKVTTQFNIVTNRFRTWFLSDMDHVSDWMSVAPFPQVTANSSDRPGEEGFQSSLFASPIYLVRAYITQENTTTLRKELPLAQSSRITPHYLDMFRLQHLVALVHRHSSITWH